MIFALICSLPLHFINVRPKGIKEHRNVILFCTLCIHLKMVAFSLAHLQMTSRVILLLLSCRFQTVTQMVRVWRNECLRVFHDRLINETDKQLVSTSKCTSKYETLAINFFSG